MHGQTQLLIINKLFNLIKVLYSNQSLDLLHQLQLISLFHQIYMSEPQDQDSVNLSRLREINQKKPIQLEHQYNASSQELQSVAPSTHNHNQSSSCQDHNHSHGHDHSSHSHSHNQRSHHGQRHGGPARKNYFIIFYTIFTCLSCLYLQTQHLNPFLADSKSQLMSYLAFFDVFMCLWSYIQTMRISSAVTKLKKKERIPYNNLHQKTCQKCDYHKMPRVSHCSTCGKCIYKLDHHCIWTQTCIGYCNQKPFYLFTLYMTIGVLQFWYSSLRVSSTLSADCHFFGVFEPGVYILWGITAISAGIVGMMIVMLWLGHTVMVISNFTTLDSMKTKMTCPVPLFECRKSYYQATHVNSWDRGEVQNLKSLFGKSLLTCWLPFGREIQNEFLFEPMSPYVTVESGLKPSPVRVSAQNIKKQLSGKEIKINDQIVKFQDL